MEIYLRLPEMHFKNKTQIGLFDSGIYGENKKTHNLYCLLKILLRNDDVIAGICFDHSRQR